MLCTAICLIWNVYRAKRIRINIISFVFLHHHVGKCTWNQKNRILDFFGNISYSLYLTHIVVYLFFKENQSIIPLLSSGTGFSKLFIMTAMSILLSSILYVAIEKPFIKIGRELLNRKSKHETALLNYSKLGN